MPALLDVMFFKDWRNVSGMDKKFPGLAEPRARVWEDLFYKYLVTLCFSNPLEKRWGSWRCMTNFMTSIWNDINFESAHSWLPYKHACTTQFRICLAKKTEYSKWMNVLISLWYTNGTENAHMLFYAKVVGHSTVHLLLYQYLANFCAICKAHRKLWYCMVTGYIAKALAFSSSP